MLTYLPDYTSLIQLLVGSVIVSVLFRKELKDPLQGLRNSYEVFFSTHTFLPEGYELVDSKSFERNLSALRKSLMLVLFIYGCMILFYCASFPNEYTTEPLTLDVYGTALSMRKDFLQPIPSPLGIAILSIIIFFYQLIIIIKPSTTIHSNNIIFILGVFVMFVLFFIFIIAIPNCYLDLSWFMGKEIWGKLLRIDWVKIINCAVLFDLVLWIGFYFRLFLASTRRFINRKNKQWEEYSYKGKISNSISLKIGILDSFQFIIEELNALGKQENNSRKRFLYKKALHELKKDHKYFSMPKESQDGAIKLYYDTNLPEQIKKEIDKCSAISRLGKWWLKQNILTEPKAKSKLPDNLNHLEQPKESSMRQLIRLGIIRKN